MIIVLTWIFFNLDMNKNNVNKDEGDFYTSLDKSAGNDESNYEALRFPEINKVSVL